MYYSCCQRLVVTLTLSLITPFIHYVHYGTPNDVLENINGTICDTTTDAEVNHNLTSGLKGEDAGAVFKDDRHITFVKFNETAMGIKSQAKFDVFMNTSIEQLKINHTSQALNDSITEYQILHDLMNPRIPTMTEVLIFLSSIAGEFILCIAFRYVTLQLKHNGSTKTKSYISGKSKKKLINPFVLFIKKTPKN